MVTGVGVRVGPRMWLGMPWWLTLLFALLLFPFWVVYVIIYGIIRLSVGSARFDKSRRTVDAQLTDAYASIYQPGKPKAVAPAGWYVAEDPRELRWWDGERWTAHTRPSATAAIS